MSNDTILREVDEELRSDRMRSLWRRFGPYVIGAAVAIVLLVAVNEGWTWWQNSNSARSSDQLYAALELAEGTDVAAAQQALTEVVTEGSGGYPSLARFRQAALLAADGKTAEAVAAYDALSTSESNSRLRDLALVLAGFLLVDSADVAAVEQRVGGLIAPTNPMRNAAREALGLVRYKSGDLAGSRQLFEEALADPLSSQETRTRLQIYVAQLIAEGVANPEAATAGAPATAGGEVTAGDPAVPPPLPDGSAAGQAPAN